MDLNPTTIAELLREFFDSHDLNPEKMRGVDFVSYLVDNNRIYDEDCSEMSVIADLYEILIFEIDSFPKFCEELYQELLCNEKFANFEYQHQLDGEIFLPYISSPDFNSSISSGYYHGLVHEPMSETMIIEIFKHFYPDFFYTEFPGMFTDSVTFDSKIYKVKSMNWQSSEEGIVYWYLEGLDEKISFSMYDELMGHCYGTDWPNFYPYPFEDPPNPFNRDFGKGVWGYLDLYRNW